MVKPLEFYEEVKKEALKVSWASRKEVMITTMMVLIMVVLAALFFLGVDQVFSTAVKYILGIGG